MSREEPPKCEGCARRDRELQRLRAEYSRVCEELDWRDEKIRVFERVIRKLI
jgi:hypothetical protein